MKNCASKCQCLRCEMSAEQNSPVSLCGKGYLEELLQVGKLIAVVDRYLAIVKGGKDEPIMWEYRAKLVSLQAVLADKVVDSNATKH